MAYFIRYTENATEDFERKCSYHNSGILVGDVSKWDTYDERSEEEILAEKWNCEVDEVVVLGGQYAIELSGLCAFELEADNEEDAIDEANEFYYNEVFNTVSYPQFAIFKGTEIGDCPEGCLMMPTKIVYVRN